MEQIPYSKWILDKWSANKRLGHINTKKQNIWIISQRYDTTGSRGGAQLNSKFSLKAEENE